MKALLTLLGAVTGAVLVLLARAVIERVRYRRVKRLVPSLLWWHAWLSVWALIGVTEAMRTRTEPDHEALDAIARSVGTVTRKTSNTYSPETPIWSDFDQCWCESDVQLRARIKGDKGGN